MSTAQNIRDLIKLIQTSGHPTKDWRPLVPPSLTPALKFFTLALRMNDLNAAQVVHNTLFPHYGVCLFYSSNHPDIISSPGYRYHAAIELGTTSSGAADTLPHAWLVAILNELLKKEEADGTR